MFAFPVRVPFLPVGLALCLLGSIPVAAAHMHPGTQLMSIDSGTILYTVASGELPYTLATLAGDDDGPAVEGILTSGETMEFEPGDRFTENKGMIHIAENRGAARW